MNFRGIIYYLGLFCFPISFLSFLNILYSSYFDYFLNFESYIITLILSFTFGLIFYFFGKKNDKKIDFQEQLILVVLIYSVVSFLISLPYFIGNYKISFIDSIFEAFSGITGTGFSIFENIKYLDPTLILWRSSSQWIGGLYFLIFIILFFSNIQYNFKLNDLVYSGDRSLNPDTNIKKVSIRIFFLYFFITLLVFSFFVFSEVRLFNALNLTMTLVSAGGFLPTNSLNSIIRTNLQEFFLGVSFLISLINIFFFYSVLKNKNIFKDQYEDFTLFLFVIPLSIVLIFFLDNITITDSILSILSSLSTSGISKDINVGNFSLYFLFVSIVGGSLISNSSGIKFLRIYILVKSSLSEIFKLVRPNNITNQNILFSVKKINNQNMKISFMIFISFFLSLFILSGILLFDQISFENSFKLSILTLTNTVSSSLYGSENIVFANLLTSSKIAIIIFMIIGKIELISVFLVIRRIFFKN